MESSCSKELDNECRDRMATRAENGTLHTVIPMVVSKNPVFKRRKLNNCSGTSQDVVSHFGRSITKNYYNFMKSGLPDRLMFYEDDKWTDFPWSIVRLVIDSFRTRRTSFELEFDGHDHLFDFLSMLHINVKTGSQRPIAWIDEGGCCFFPEVYSVDNERNNHLCQECMNCAEKNDSFSVPRDIKLHLEIDVSGADRVKWGKSNGESNVVEQIQIEESGCNVDEHATAGNEVRLSSSENESRDERLEDVRSSFLALLGSSQLPEYVAISDASGPYAEARSEQFIKQVDMTNRLRGDANVRSAWLPARKEHAFANAIYERGVGTVLSNKAAYATSLHLIAANRTDISASYFDVDENGSCHVFLCRVVLGNLEVVSPGSEQFSPGSPEFDNGVDNLQNPQCYVVWPMNVNTHVYPEYVISFTVASWSKGCDSSSITTEGLPLKDQQSGSPNVTGNDRPAALDSAVRVPKSSWMPFPVLFSAIAGKVSPKDMNIVCFHYQLLKSKKISREDFIGQLRLIIGDDVLKSALIRLQNKLSPEQRLDSPPLKKEAP